MTDTAEWSLPKKFPTNTSPSRLARGWENAGKDTITSGKPRSRFSCLIGGKAGKALRRKAVTAIESKFTNCKARKEELLKTSSILFRKYDSVYTRLHGICENCAASRTGTLAAPDVCESVLTPRNA